MSVSIKKIEDLITEDYLFLQYLHKTISGETQEFPKLVFLPDRKGLNLPSSLTFRKLAKHIISNICPTAKVEVELQSTSNWHITLKFNNFSDRSFYFAKGFVKQKLISLNINSAERLNFNIIDMVRYEVLSNGLSFQSVMFSMRDSYVTFYLSLFITEILPEVISALSTISNNKLFNEKFENGFYGQNLHN